MAIKAIAPDADGVLTDGTAQVGVIARAAKDRAIVTGRLEFSRGRREGGSR